MFDKVHPAFNASDEEMERQEELMLIQVRIIIIDGINDDEYSAWKRILKKVKAYNAEHE